VARATRRAAERLLLNAKRTLRNIPGNGTLRRAVDDLGELVSSTGRLLAQTELRLAGETTIPDRMVSLADPDARPIRKGKLSQPVQFGYKLALLDGREGFIEGYQLVAGNPPDAALMSPVVDALIATRGRPPAAIAADRGFGTGVVEDDLRARGIRTVVIPRVGKPPPERQAHERGRHFRRLVRWRTGCEGRISHFKRRFGGRRTRFRRLRGARTWVGFGVMAHNLEKVGAAG
jgi:IS5 family transposase